MSIISLVSCTHIPLYYNIINYINLRIKINGFYICLTLRSVFVFVNCNSSAETRLIKKRRRRIAQTEIDTFLQEAHLLSEMRAPFTMTLLLKALLGAPAFSFYRSTCVNACFLILLLLLFLSKFISLPLEMKRVKVK